MGMKRNRGKADLREHLCRRYCAYYKPGKDEELACGGYLMLQKLLAQGPLKLDAASAMYRSDTAGRLSAFLCKACPFYEDSCDFAAMVVGASPCGGFVVIASLLEGGVVSIDGLRDLL